MLLRRLSAVEALGRVDVACADKTGTLTEGRLSVRLVADSEHEALLATLADDGLRQVLLTAALASPHPHPDAAGASAHRTDVAIVQAARDAGLFEALSPGRRGETPFDPGRPFRATALADRVCVKGAPEEICLRCTRLRRGDCDWPLDEAGRQALLDRARSLADRGLRVLMIAEGSLDVPLEDPGYLVALGFISISDPFRPSVPAAVQRCREAGVRLVMITGDHPATARTIAREAGILDEDGERPAAPRHARVNRTDAPGLGLDRDGVARRRGDQPRLLFGQLSPCLLTRPGPRPEGEDGPTTAPLSDWAVLRFSGPVAVMNDMGGMDMTRQSKVANPSCLK